MFIPPPVDFDLRNYDSVQPLMGKDAFHKHYFDTYLPLYKCLNAMVSGLNSIVSFKYLFKYYCYFHRNRTQKRKKSFDTSTKDTRFSWRNRSLQISSKCLFYIKSIFVLFHY